MPSDAYGRSAPEALSSFMSRSCDSGNKLLQPDAARDASPEKREQWVNAARDILKNETQEQIDARSLSDRLSLAAASYGFWLQRLGKPAIEEGEWPKLNAIAKALPNEDKQALADDLGLQVKALKALSVPSEYFRMVEHIFDLAYTLFLQEPGVSQTMAAWGKVAAENFLNPQNGLLKVQTPEGRMSDEARYKLDAAGVTHDKMVAVMNAASTAINKAWIEEMERIGIHDKPRAMRVEIAAESERHIEFNALRDAQGNGYYKVGATNAALIDPRSAMHVAFHEPQHQIQHLIGELIKDGQVLPKYMQDASRIFRLLGDFGARNCPPEALEVSPTAKENAYAAYKLSRWEETAFYQGNMASIEINRMFMPSIAPKLASWLEASPVLEQSISKETRDWAAGFSKPQLTKPTASVSKLVV